MDHFFQFFVAAIQITFLDLVLSGDNVGIIALAIRNLPEKQAKRASAIGIAGAITLNITFASFITIIMSYEWLPLRLIGGLLLLKITYDLISMGDEADNNETAKAGKANMTFWRAIISILIADVSMSLDNVLAIGATAHGHIGLIAFGLALNFPILLFGSKFVANLMQKFKLAIYIGGAILMHTALQMIMEDHFIAPHVPHWIAMYVPWLLAFTVLCYGYVLITKEKVAEEHKAKLV